jgi:renal tumor antigen
MQKYRLISRQGEGTFSEVFKAQSVKNGKYTAIKCMKNKFDSIEQVRCGALYNILAPTSINFT